MAPCLGDRPINLDVSHVCAAQGKLLVCLACGSSQSFHSHAQHISWHWNQSNWSLQNWPWCTQIARLDVLWLQELHGRQLASPSMLLAQTKVSWSDLSCYDTLSIVFGLPGLPQNFGMEPWKQGLKYFFTVSQTLLLDMAIECHKTSTSNWPPESTTRAGWHLPWYSWAPEN